MKNEITLGNTVRDIVTNFEGIATARIKYINGCIQYCVKPQMTESGKMPEGEYIDIDQLEVVNDGVVVKTQPTGGPQKDCPKN